MIFPIFKSIFFSCFYEYCERVFGCQHFHFTFWFLMGAAGVILALGMLPLTYWSILGFASGGLFERINFWLNVLLLVVGLSVIWVMKCNKL